MTKDEFLREAERRSRRVPMGLSPSDYIVMQVEVLFDMAAAALADAGVLKEDEPAQRD